VLGGQAVAACVGVGVGVGDGQEPGHSLLLEPLPDVALGRAGAGRQLARGCVTLFGERSVEAEASADVDGSNLQAVDGGGERPLDERVGGAGGRGCNGLGQSRSLPGLGRQAVMMAAMPM
jgi:hypothetical protein